MERYSESKYETLKEITRVKYNSFSQVMCPALNQPVHFTADGLNHIIYKNKKRERNKQDQFARFQILELAKEIISKTTTIQEIEDSYQEVTVKIKKRKERILKQITCWGFIAIEKKMKLKIIVKKTGGGKIIFWSVIPFWKTSKRDGIHIKTYSTGNMKED